MAWRLKLRYPRQVRYAANASVGLSELPLPGSSGLSPWSLRSPVLLRVHKLSFPPCSVV
jgi:hypothetical protein